MKEVILPLLSIKWIGVDTIIDIGIYITILTVVIGTLLTYNRQLKLKSFEYFFERRKEILNDIEKSLEDLYLIREEIAEGKTKNLNRYLRKYFHEGLILYHKIKSANFGEIVNFFNETYIKIIKDAEIREAKNETIDYNDLIERTTNVLAKLYGYAHSCLNEEMEMLTLSFHKQLAKKLRKK